MNQSYFKIKLIPVNPRKSVRQKTLSVTISDTIQDKNKVNIF